MRTRPCLCAALTAALVLVTCAISTGSVVEYYPSVEFSGAPPSGPPPWLKVAFDDEDTPGSVLFELTALNLVDKEFVSKLYLNFDPALDVTGLIFDDPVKVGQFSVPSVSLDEDGWNVAGSGRYDIKLKFSTSNKGGGTKRFGAGESLLFAISGIPTLTADSFDFFSTGGGNGAFPLAAHIQSINCGDSGWVTDAGGGVIPEPVTMTLMSAGGLVILRRRRR